MYQILLASSMPMEIGTDRRLNSLIFYNFFGGKLKKKVHLLIFEQALRCWRSIL